MEAECIIYGTDSTQPISDNIYCKIDSFKFPYFSETHKYLEFQSSFNHENITINNWGSYFGKKEKIQLINDCYVPYNYKFTLSKNYLFKEDYDTNQIIFAVTGNLEENNQALFKEQSIFFNIMPNFFVDDNYYNDADCSIAINKGKLSGDYVMVCYLNAKNKVQFFQTIAPTLYDSNSQNILIDSSSIYSLKSTLINYSKFSGLFLLLFLII